MTFRVGQKVVCVDDGNFDKTSQKFFTGLPKASVVYVIRSIIDRPHGWGVCLEGIVGKPHADGLENAFWHWRFRPVVEKKTDISALTALFNPANHKKLESA